MRFPRLLAAAALALYCTSTEPVTVAAQDYKVTEAEINQATRWRSSEITAWKSVDLKGGENCIFVYYQGPPTPTFFILKKQGDRLISGLMSQPRIPSVVEEINLTDMGHDGKKEVEVLFKNGRRRYYFWGGGEYKSQDASSLHGAPSDWNQVDDFYYKDLDRDGTDEAIVIFSCELRKPFGTKPGKILGVYKWQHGWTPFKYGPLDAFEMEYEAFSASSPDTLLLEEGHQRIRNKIRDYLSAR
ncbi:MAG: hypothetical protein AABX14_00800 [Candidatus Aenigmatarchaeota archaeon]